MGYRAAMDDDRVNDRVDEAVLALVYLGIVERHPMGGARTWKSFNWSAMERLYGKGLISDPVSKAKSVVLNRHRSTPGRSGLPQAVRVR